MRAIILYNRSDNTYTKISHNLNDEEADREVQMLRKGAMPAFYIRQRKMHSSLDPDHCSECDRDITDVTNAVTRQAQPRDTKAKLIETLIQEDIGYEEI